MGDRVRDGRVKALGVPRARRRRGRGARWAVLLPGAVAFAFGFTPIQAQASVLRLRAPDQCAQASEVSDQVETLLGRPLAAIEGVDFEVEIARPAGRSQWQLRLDRIDRSAEVERSSRQLTGHSCAELASAAAVAIAMSIRASAAPNDVPTLSPSVSPSAPPSPTVSAAAARVSAIPKAAPPLFAATGAARRAAPRGSLTVAVVADAGALPSPGVGGALEAALDLDPWRFMILGALFASQEARIGRLGGDFSLALGAALACRSQPLGRRLRALACGGAEVGRLAGEGRGVDAPRLGSALWLAPRAELGLAAPLTAALTLVARAGATVPLSRPVFLADQTVPIHQAHRVGARVTVGIELGF